MGRHAGLSRVVENFCLETVKKKLDQRNAEKSYGITGDGLTTVPWSAPALEQEWRAAHPVSCSRGSPRNECPPVSRRKRAGFGLLGSPTTSSPRKASAKARRWAFRRGASASTAPASAMTPTAPSRWIPAPCGCPAIGDVQTREDMSWLTDRMATGEARILGATIRQQAGRWWISFQVDVDRDEINKRHRVDEHAPKCGIDLGLKTFAVIRNSDGTREEIHAPKPLQAAQRALKRANRTLARVR